MKWSRVPACLCAALLGTAAIARSQSAPAQPAPSFKAGVELVRLDVRVTDTEGRPVRDITQKDIEVIEDGGSRPVVFFQHVAEPAGSYAEIASHTVAGEVSTNQGAARGHLYVLVFDQHHIVPGNEQRARRAAQQFLRTRLRPGDRVAAYGLPGPGPQIGFTPDARRVVSALNNLRGIAVPEQLVANGSMTVHEAFQIVRGDEEILKRVVDRDVTHAISTDAKGTNREINSSSDARSYAVSVHEDARAIVNRADGETRQLLAMFADVLRPMRAIEGRKTVILLSEGFYSDNLTREVEEVAAAAAQSYSVVYALDLNRRDADSSVGEPAGADQYTGILDRLNPLGSLAVETGGLLINDASAHAEQAFAALGDQSQDYYLVGFAPRDAALRDRGKYRRVSIRVKRAGVRVSTRTGYALGDQVVRADRRQTIDRALAAPFSQQSLPIRYTTYVLRGASAGMQRVIVSLAAELPLASHEQSSAADVVFAVRSAADGKVVASGTDVIALPDRRGQDRTAGTGSYHVQFELPAGEYVMRAVVREPGGLVGSADRRFVVRALDGPSVASGDLVVSAQRGELPVRPTAYTGDGLSGVLELYGRAREQLDDLRVTFNLVAIGEETPIVSGAAELDDTRALSSGVGRVARVEVPLEGIPAGAYVARATVKAGPDTVAEVAREVEIMPGTRPADAAEADSDDFDPQEIVKGAFARELTAELTRTVPPGSAEALRGLDSLRARDYPAAIAAFQAALAAPTRAAGGPSAPGIAAATAFFLGWSYHGAGDDRQAISAWRRAAYEDPTIVPAHLALADMYLRLSQPGLAAQALRAGLTALPQSPELLDRLSRLESRR
jgi:VWFA-related protein